MPVNSFDNYHMSWKPRRDRLTAPIYLSLAAMLEEDILSGLIPRGTRLPPQRLARHRLHNGDQSIQRMQGKESHIRHNRARNVCLPRSRKRFTRNQ